VNVLLLILGAAMLGVSAGLLAAIARPPTRALYVVGAGVVAAAIVIGCSILLSLVGAYGRGGLLVAEAVVLALSIAAWRLSGAPKPPAAWRALLADVPDAVRAHPAVAVLCVFAGLALLLQLIVGLTTAPSNWDSMTYHLSRIAYWLQEGSALHFDGGSVRQLASPPNAELLQGWTMALSDGDRFVALIQWLALVGCAAGVFSVARSLRFSHSAALLAAAVFVVLPSPIIEATTTQNDIVAAATVIATLALGIPGLRDRRIGLLVLAGIAVGVGIGVKGTVGFALPSLILVLVVVAATGRVGWRPVAQIVVAGACGFLLFGAFNHILNLEDTGSLFGGLDEMVNREQSLHVNVVQLGWTFVESPGISLPFADRFLQSTIAEIVPQWQQERFAFVVGSNVNEDVVSAGLIGWLVLWPVVLITLFARRSPPDRRALAAAAVLYVLVFAVFVGSEAPFNGRYMNVAAVIGAPLIALAATRAWSRALVVAIAIVGLLPALVVNQFKPLLTDRGQPNIWQLDRTAQMSATRPEQDALIRAVDAQFPADARIGFVGLEDAWDYPFFGPNLDRHITRAPNWPKKLPAEQRCQWLADMARENDLAGFVLAMIQPPPAELRAAQPAPGHFIATRAQVEACARAQAAQ
jgi:hypothetical protein